MVARSAIFRSLPKPACRTMKVKSSDSPPARGVTVEAEFKASPAKGQATEVQAREIVVHGWAKPESYDDGRTVRAMDILVP
jgi:hypothetical protein